MTFHSAVSDKYHYFLLSKVIASLRRHTRKCKRVLILEILNCLDCTLVLQDGGSRYTRLGSDIFLLYLEGAKIICDEFLTVAVKSLGALAAIAC